MSSIISTKASRDNNKVWYYLEWGRAAGQRKSAGVFTYTKPKNKIEKNHNKKPYLYWKPKNTK